MGSEGNGERKIVALTSTYCLCGDHTHFDSAERRYCMFIKIPHSMGTVYMSVQYILFGAQGNSKRRCFKSLLIVVPHPQFKLVNRFGNLIVF